MSDFSPEPLNAAPTVARQARPHFPCADNGSSDAQTPVTIRVPRPADGATMRRLAREAGGLDVNSTYYYIMMCSYFSSTCRIACSGESAVGFVTGFRPSDISRTLLIHQIGVSPEWRGKGIGKSMLLALLAGRDGAPEFIEATISPSNLASRALFNWLSRKIRADQQFRPEFTADLFLPELHEPEDTVRIGPINQQMMERLNMEEIKP